MVSLCHVMLLSQSIRRVILCCSVGWYVKTVQVVQYVVGAGLKSRGRVNDKLGCKLFGNLSY